MTENTTNSGYTLTLTNAQLEDYIDVKTLSRHNKLTHSIFGQFPNIREIETVVFWGVFSWAIPHYGSRWLLKRSIVNTKNGVNSVGDIVRDYLDFYHPKKLRATGFETKIYHEHVSAPLFVRPSTLVNGSYVDIKAAFFSLLCMVGWDISYIPGRWLTAGRAPLDFPLVHDKTARNYLVTAGLINPITVWTGHRMIFKQGKNVHTNLCLWRFIMDVLHSIANTAIELGAIYVHTDGYILPSQNSYKLIDYIKQWGLDANIKAEGQTYVFGFGNYQCGDRSTLSFEPRRVSFPNSNIRRIDGSWLRGNIANIAKRGTAERLYELSLSRYA